MAIFWLWPSGLMSSGTQKICAMPCNGLQLLRRRSPQIEQEDRALVILQLRCDQALSESIE